RTGSSMVAQHAVCVTGITVVRGSPGSEHHGIAGDARLLSTASTHLKECNADAHSALSHVGPVGRFLPGVGAGPRAVRWEAAATRVASYCADYRDGGADGDRADRPGPVSGRSVDQSWRTGHAFDGGLRHLLAAFRSPLRKGRGTWDRHGRH